MAWPPPALVLTAGLGTRLRPLSAYRAKPAMPVGSDVLVCRILRNLSACGVREAVLNLHHLPHTVTREVGDGSGCGVRVRYSWEQPRVLGSAGGPRHALPLIDAENILIVNGDTLCDLPIRALYDAHLASGARVTLGLMPHPQPGRYGGVVLAAGTPAGASRTVEAFVPRTSAVPSVHFPGVQLVHRSVLAALPDNTPGESVLEVYPRLMTTEPGSVQGVVFDARFDDVGTVDDYRRTCRALAGDPDGNVIDPLATVASDARLRGCIVWPGATVPAGCDLVDVIVSGYVPVPHGTCLRDAIL